MKGKIFPESSNLCQDEAKILFEFYKKAAERIVSEEERIEKEISVLEEKRAQLEKQISGLWVWFLTIILFFVYFIKKKGLLREVADVDDRIAEFRKQHKEIFRDYKVSKLGVAYVPVAGQIKYEDKSFIVDYTGQVEDSQVTLQMSRQNDLLIDTIARFETQASTVPVVETSQDVEPVNTEEYSKSIQSINENDYMGGLDRALKTISFCMDDLDTTSVALPLVEDHSSYLGFLNEYATKDIPEGAPVVPVFDKERFDSSIDKFKDLNKLKDSLSTKTQQFEDVLKSLMVTMARSVQTVSALKVASVDKVVLDSNKVLFQILKSPYNHYSPALEYDEIERIRNEKFDYSTDVQGYEPFHLKQSSRVRYNLLTGLWTSEDGNTTNTPFGVHQIYEEIVAPVVQNLMNENRVERLKIYNSIKDQKLSYLNKWHQDTDAFYRANRAESSDIINLMQETLREYVAAYNTLVSLQRTEDSMVSEGSLDSTVVKSVDNAADTLAAFELQSQEFQKTQTDFEDFMDRLKDDIEVKAEKFGHVEYYDAKLRDGYSNEVAVAADEIHALDKRRKSLASVNPLLAKKSDLPPEPSIEDLTYEHMSLNLPVMAQNALEELQEKARLEKEALERAAASEAASDDSSASEPADDVAADDIVTDAAADGSQEDPQQDDGAGYTDQDEDPDGEYTDEDPDAEYPDEDSADGDSEDEDSADGDSEDEDSADEDSDDEYSDEDYAEEDSDEEYVDGDSEEEDADEESDEDAQLQNGKDKNN